MQDPDSDVFRQTLSRFATGVCVITALDVDGKPVGITVNSFASVSLDPPLVVFCLKKAALRAPVFAETTRYSISILAEHQKDLARHFASHGPTSWDQIGQTLLPDFAPFMKESLAQIACEKRAVYEGGDHNLYLTHVVGMNVETAQKPLLFFASQYAQLEKPLVTHLKAS